MPRILKTRLGYNIPSQYCVAIFLTLIDIQFKPAYN